MKTLQTTTRQDEVYLTLRQWLSLGRWRPGERLKIRQIAQELPSGDMPVRTALQRLVAEGALVNVPHCGVSVPLPDKAGFDDILRTRMLLEGEAAERGAAALGDDARQTLRALAGQMEAAIAAHALDAYLEANEAFHRCLYAAAGSPLLMTLIETVWLHVGPLSNRLADEADVWSRMNDAHRDLLDAVERGDPAAVRRALERDLFTAGQYLRTCCTA